ncbi:MAG: GAF domain-containing protein, partial [Acetobacteraceae bacterium]|nr:GAF domain-containing protein [Acetobacteraceae bacterium]
MGRSSTATKAGSLADGVDAVLVRLADRLSGQIDPAAILSIAAELVGQHLAANRCGYGEVEIDQDEIVIPVDWTDGVQSMVGRYPLRRGSIFVREYEAGRVGVVSDADALELAPAVRETLAAMRCRAFIAAPLIHEGKLVGLFAVHSREARHWTPAEIALVERTAAMTWSALRHAHTGALLRESEESFRMLADNIPGICWLANTEGRAYWMNAAGRRYFGDADAATNTPSAVVHPDDLGPSAAMWKRA